MEQKQKTCGIFREKSLERVSSPEALDNIAGGDPVFRGDPKPYYKRPTGTSK